MSPMMFSRAHSCWLCPVELFLLSSLALSAPQAGLQQLRQQAHQAEDKANYADAEQLYRQALTLAPHDLDTLTQLGLLYQKELKFGDSLKMFQEVLKANPLYPEANLFEGISYLAQNNPESAINCFDRELHNPHPHAQAHYYLGLALRASGRNDEAIEQLNQALRDNPKDADALFQLVHIHKAEAVAAMERAAVLGNGDEATRLTNLARHHADAAREEVSELRDLDADSYQWHALMGEAYGDQQRYAESLREYRAALAKRPEAMGLHFSIGANLWTLGQYDEAEVEFHRALRENPGDPKTNLYLAGIAVRKQQFDKALEFTAVAQTREPDSAVVHHMLGKCYFELKNYDKAKSELLATVQANPQDSGAHYLLARVYRQLGDLQASAQELDTFQRLMKSEKDSTANSAEKQLTGDAP